MSRLLEALRFPEEIRRDALAIFHAGLKAVDAADAVKRHLRIERGHLKVAGESYDLSVAGGIYVVGAGKAAAKMAQAVEELLENRLTAGIVNVKYGHALSVKKIKINEAGHPLPDEAGVRGTNEMIRLLQETDADDLVLCLLSGGGSALLASPAEGLTLEDKQRTTKLLLECGATIREINAIRKHLSEVKGGRLARLASPSLSLALILSDVVGDDLSTIASGPTVPDSTTFDECMTILGRYGLQGRIPPAVRIFVEKGIRGEIPETPKLTDPLFLRGHNVIVGNNLEALGAAREKAEGLGYHVFFLSNSIEGETREAAKLHAAIAKEVLRTGRPVPRPACILSGGETTVNVRGKGMGGRNQEFALAAALDIDGLEEVVVLSAGTDGTDGPTDAAGAFADGTTLRRARDLGLAPEAALGNNDSYPFFKRLGDLVVTGPTLTNVMDLRVVLVG